MRLKQEVLARPRGGRVACLLCACVLYLVPLRAEAMEVDFGASVGGMMAGGLPRFALSPYGAVSWPQGDHFVFVIHDMLSLLLTAGNHGPGGYDHLTVAGGVAWGDGKIIVGPSLSIFSMPACGPQWCARVGGFGAGANARADLFFWGPVGLSLSGNVDVPIQSNSVLPGGPVVTGLLGAVYRIR